MILVVAGESARITHCINANDVSSTAVAWKAERLADGCTPLTRSHNEFLYYPSRRQQPAALAALVDTLRLENRRK